MQMNGMWVILFGSNIEGKEFNHFMTILLLDPYFKINGWIYRGILEILVKKLLNLISFPPISLKFRGKENLRFKRNREEWVFSPTHSIPSHLNS